jgi:hypothetical protein
MEEFKIIQEFENYSVSNLGCVKNDKTNIILKPYTTKGYNAVKLNRKNKQYTLYIHRLVASAFIPNPDNKLYVDHIDNNRQNNNINNLRWCTHQENQQNQKIKINNTSGYKGVYYCKWHNKWRAEICHNYKSMKLGYFERVEDAIIARYNKAKEIQGEFINECEKIQYDTAILKKQKQQELKEIEELEKELEAILNK